MKIPFVDLKAQYYSIKTEVDTAICDIIENTAFIQGPAVKKFEVSFAKAIGIKNCIAVANGTEALIISLKTLGIGVGDEVIVPANSFIATSESVTWSGAKVIFVDNNPDTYNLDASKLEEKISSNTKAIIVVHLYGQVAEMDLILQIAKKHNLFVIEDSAQAHLAEYKTRYGEWKKSGTFGDIATFSFYPGKNLGAYGDAGAIVTNNDELARKARMYANHGRIAKYDHSFEGINSRMDGIQAAVLNIKLKYLSDWTEKRRKVAIYYIERLKNIEGLHLPYFGKNNKPVWHLFVVRTDYRDELRNYLDAKDIATGIHYPIALPNLLAYKYLDYSKSDFPIASEYQDKLLSLPIFPEMSITQLNHVTSSIIDFYKLKNGK